MPQEMRVNPDRARQLLENLKHVSEKISSANASSRPVRLIAVSKLHPASSILALHNHSSFPPSARIPDSPSPHYHFGENYLQELQQKADLLPKTIKWHFIGSLQTNKCKPLAEGVENLWCVSSVDTAKKADALDKGRKALKERLSQEGKTEELEKLRVQVQVNTSGEAEKSGVEPADVEELCKHIRETCPHLQLSGLMTIGAIARSRATTKETENEDFVCLRETRDRVSKSLGIKKEELELSMGMSSDFEGAIAQGSDEVRIGSTLFGERPPKAEAKVLDDTEEEQG